MSLSASIMFRSERFDYKSDLPEDYNAGNRFYGKDVAGYLSDQLVERGFPADYLDEDWGWLIHSLKGNVPEFEIAVYNLAEHGEGGRPGVGEWGLWVRSYERKKFLGLIPKKAEVAVPASLLAAVEASVRAVGAEPEKWREGPNEV
jgi:hypothetical protein